MSFCFSVRDFVGTVQLAYNLYKYSFKVSRDAPQEFKLLVTELGTIRTPIDFLADKAKDPESTSASGGEARVRLVSDLLERIRGTLEALQKHAKKNEKARKLAARREVVCQNAIQITTL